MAFGSVNIGGGPSSEMAGAAVNISYDNKKSEADATNVQDALDTVFKKKADLNESGKLSEEQLPDMNVSEAFVNTAQKDAPNNNDAVLITDSEDKNIPKRVLWSKIKALFAAASHTLRLQHNQRDPLCGPGRNRADHPHPGGHHKGGTPDLCRDIRHVFGEHQPDHGMYLSCVSVR